MQIHYPNTILKSIIKYYKKLCCKCIWCRPLLVDKKKRNQGKHTHIWGLPPLLRETCVAHCWLSYIYTCVCLCVCLCVYVCVCRRWLLERTCYYCEYVCPIMKCGGTDTERPVLPIAGCHIYIHVFVCVCVSVCLCVCLYVKSQSQGTTSKHQT